MSIKSQIESLLFISAKPMTIKQLSGLLKKKAPEITTAGNELVDEYRDKKSGVQIIKNGSKFQMVSSSENARLIQDFIKDETYLFYETDGYIFVHGGCDPTQPLDASWMETFIWDRSLFQLSKKFVASGKELPWDKTVVCGHSSNGPWINEKLMMLDCSSFKKLLVLELDSMQAFTASPGNVRLERFDLKAGQNKIKTKNRKSFRRIP